MRNSHDEHEHLVRAAISARRDLEHLKRAAGRPRSPRRTSFLATLLSALRIVRKR